MINRKYKWGYAVVIALCVAAMAAGAKYDWIITDTLYNPQSYFGVIFEAISWVPIYAFIPLWGASMMLRNKNSMGTFTFGAVLLICSCSVMAYSVCSHFAERNFKVKANPYICGIIGGIISAAIFIIMRGLDKNTVRRIQAVCSFAFMYMASYFAVILALKKIVGRDRYDDIITGGEYAFADWFKPVFFSEGSSFPSGHTAAAMGVVVLLLLPFMFKAFKNKKRVIFVGCYVYAAVTAFSRIIMGRHFLSDTAMSILVMTIIFIVLTPAFEKSYRKLILKN